MLLAYILKKKFSKRPPPNVIVSVVEKSNFYKSIETFGTAIARNSKTFRIKKDQVLEMNIAHNEGNYFTSPDHLKELKDKDLLAF